MSEKSEKTKKKLIQNADKITIGVLVLILLGLGYAWWQEQNSGLGAAETAGRPATFQDSLADSTTLQMLQTMSPDPNITTDGNAERVAQLSMFDSSTVEEERARETAAQNQIADAKNLIDQGQIEQARGVLEYVLSVARYNKEAVDLMDSITTKTETAPTEQPTPPM